MSPAPTANPEDIEREIERTRDRMTGTIQAIEEKLSPNRWMDEAIETMRNINLSESRVMDFLRDNPIPLALIGAGVGWMVLSALRPAQAVQETAEDYAEAGYPGTIANLTDKVADKAEEWAGYGAGGNNGSGQAAGMMEEAREQAGSMVDTLRSRAGSLTDSMQSGARRLGGQLNRATRQMRERAGGLADTAGEAFQEHPLTVGLLAVAAGLAIGAALPRTRRETELLGDTGSDLLETAREGGRNLLSKAGQATRRVVQTATEAGADTLQRTKRAAKDEMRSMSSGQTTH